MGERERRKRNKNKIVFERNLGNSVQCSTIFLIINLCMCFRTLKACRKSIKIYAKTILMSILN